MSLTRLGTLLRLRRTGVTSMVKILQAPPGIHVQYSDNLPSSISHHRCFCTHHRIQIKRKSVLFKSNLCQRYHSSKSKLPDEEASATNDNTTTPTTELKDDPGYISFSSTTPGTITEGFIPFEDEKQVIQDAQEQQWNPIQEHLTVPRYNQDDVNRERGQTGVFDLEELVDLLRAENAHDVCVIAIPKEMKYADHMVIVTARSARHMFALATFIRKRFKMKERKPSDHLPKIEGSKKSTDWVALDLGNIALHVFTSSTREEMDLETLWTVGPLFDDLVNTKDTEIVQLLNLFSSSSTPTPPRKW